MKFKLPVLTKVLEEVDFFERERTDESYVELGLVLYDAGLSLRKTEKVLNWLGVDVSHVAVWEWVNKLGEKLTGSQPVNDLPDVILMDETSITQSGEEFTLFAALHPETREVVHLNLYPTRNYLTTTKFLREIEEIYDELPEAVVTDNAVGYGAAFQRLSIQQYVIHTGVRNRIERWFQELKRRINAFYASFTGKSVEPTQNWLRQFAWFWNNCLT
ncbi:MAG: IS6 family transposase [Halobacteria archaeon]|nr:IS6 family transposase [Halobacteria archaeon]